MNSYKILLSLFSSVVTIGFIQRVYKVKESVGAVKVCATLKGNVELDKAVVVQYGTEDQSAVGMMCVLMFVFVCVCVHAHACLGG